MNFFIFQGFDINKLSCNLNLIQQNLTNNFFHERNDTYVLSKFKYQFILSLISKLFLIIII